MAGAFMNETQIYKAIAMSNFGDGPFVKGIVMARAPLTAVMKSSYFEELAREGKLPKAFSDKYGSSPDKFFKAIPDLEAIYGKEKVRKIPYPAIGLYTYFTDRIGVGLKQLLAGSRKFRLDLISRGDLASLTERAHKVTGIPLLEDLDSEQMELILDS
jgi:hypothetical protein